jgi:hypothetical protein
MINTKAYLDAGRYVMTQHGGYTDAEVDVLSEWNPRRLARDPTVLTLQLPRISRM